MSKFTESKIPYAFWSDCVCGGKAEWLDCLVHGEDVVCFKIECPECGEKDSDCNE